MLANDLIHQITAALGSRAAGSSIKFELKKKVEQQAFAGKGLDFVARVYLPQRLSEMGMIRGEILSILREPSVRGNRLSLSHIHR